MVQNVQLNDKSAQQSRLQLRYLMQTYKNKAFIDIRLRPGIAMPLVAIRPITAKRDVFHKTGST